MKVVNFQVALPKVFLQANKTSNQVCTLKILQAKKKKKKALVVVIQDEEHLR